MFNKKRYYIIAIFIITLFIFYLHYSTTPQEHIMHNILTELHYIPLLLSALVFGLKGAVITFIFITVLYLPHFFATSSDPFLSLINRLVHLLFSGLFAFLAGFLVDREKKHREHLEKERYLAGIGQVATTIVHDLKNPLITILGFAKRIQEGKGSDTAAEAIIDSARNMQRVVHDVLDFAKPIHLALKEEDMRNVISRACGYCKAKADGEEVNLVINMPAEPVNIVTDGFHMERAIINVVNNAIDASHRGREVTLSMMQEKEYLTIKVEDQGSGMDKETIENVFVPFYTKKSNGTGLGMSIVKKIIDGHLGKINIKSQPGKGTEVMIKLPYDLKATT